MNDDWLTPPRPTLRHVHDEWASTEYDFIPADWPGDDAKEA